MGPGVVIGDFCRVQQGVTLGGSGSASGDGSPTLEDCVVVGAGARILGPVVIGRGSIIGANAVVLRSCASDSTLIGIPARSIVRSETNSWNK
jgi:serine O-acetyltransferase